MKSILGVSLLILLMPSAYAASLPGDSADGKRLCIKKLSSSPGDGAVLEPPRRGMKVWA